MEGHGGVGAGFLHLSAHLSAPKGRGLSDDRSRLRAIYPWSSFLRDVPASVLHKRGGRVMVRVLVTVEPRIYREAVAQSIRRASPGAEVKVTPPR